MIREEVLHVTRSDHGAKYSIKTRDGRVTKSFHPIGHLFEECRRDVIKNLSLCAEWIDLYENLQDKDNFIWNSCGVEDILLSPKIHDYKRPNKISVILPEVGNPWEFNCIIQYEYEEEQC